MRGLIQKLKDWFIKNPAFLLVLLVYLYIIPQSLSYDNAWMQPEEFNIKRCVLFNGPNVSSFDLRNGLNWKQFENFQPRCSRPLSSYFEIIDTKFRSWVWHFMMPHPSLSLTWLFTFVLAPLLLYKLLRNAFVSSNVAVALTAFYISTPEVLSCGSMLFRPAKPMTNFFLILCLYVASQLKKKFIDQGKEISRARFIGLWMLIGFTCFWDETALIILPAMYIFFPQLFKARSRLFLFLTLPLMIILAYFIVIPYLTLLAGYDFPHLMAYRKVDEFKYFEILFCSIQLLGINAKNLILETMGIIEPVSNAASMLVKSLIIAAVMSWGLIFYYISKSRIKLDLRLLFLLTLVLFFNYLMTITNGIWGPYYYGDFWAVFFVYWLAVSIEKAQIPKFLLTGFFVLILISAYFCFMATNTIYKKYHFYPCTPLKISSYFEGEDLRFDPRDKSPFSGKDLKTIIHFYWVHSENGGHVSSSYLPRELYWVALELEPNQSHPRYILPGDTANYPDQND